jgi:N-carbamoylputrescine amidase
MLVTVCELPDSPELLSEAWNRLVSHVRDQRSELVLLPEMPFHTWLPRTDRPSDRAWARAVADHDAYQARFGDLGGATVIATRPVVVDGRRLNEAFVWESGEYQAAHHKYYLPDEEGWWEATWYERGDKSFVVTPASAGPVGMLVCTELWFTRHAWDYGKQGATIVASPRASEWTSREAWLAGGRTAAVMAGAFGLSSNRSGIDHTGIRWGGYGWVVDPDGGVLATTSEDVPFATVDVDLAEAVEAKGTYPRYVRD